MKNKLKSTANRCTIFSVFIQVRKTFVRNIYANGAQLAINQVFGFLIFYLLSNHLSKADFGELNWTLAVFITCFSVLSFGLDQVLVRKVAAGDSTSETTGLYLFHVVLSGLLFYTTLLIGSILFPHFFAQHSLLLLMGIGKLLFSFSTPFKQLTTGRERFPVLLYMSIISSVAKGVLLFFLYFTSSLTLYHSALVFVFADGLEWLLTLFIYQYFFKERVRFFFNRKAYFLLLKESMAQAGVTFFSAALARMDWILIGLFLSATKLAEYGFAYKIFELSTFPLLVIAPLLVPFISRKGSLEKDIHLEKRLRQLVHIELVIAAFTVLLLNLFWKPIIDPLTGGHYGAVNAKTIFILSLSIPLLYLNNFLWSFHFAQGGLKMIFRIFALTFLINLLLNAFLIPVIGNEGAAISFLLSILIQTILYSKKAAISMTGCWQQLFGYSFASLLCCGFAKLLFTSLLPTSIFSITLFAFILLIGPFNNILGRKHRPLLLWQRGNP